MLRQKMVWSLVIATAAAFVSTAAQAEVLWNGSGTPTGYGLTGAPDYWHADWEGNVDGSVDPVATPGIMYVSTYQGPNAADNSAVTYYSLNSTAATTELNSANGWNVEVREKCLGATGAGSCLWLGDGGGMVSMMMHRGDIQFFGGQFDVGPTTVSITPDVYHTITMIAAPDATSVGFYLDGALAATVGKNSTSGAGPVLSFGDLGSTAWGRTNWDYVNVNAVPEPSTFVILTTALFGLLAYAWRKRK